MVDLLFFTGRECSHCQSVKPLVERLKQEENIKIEELEVWHNSQNKKLMEKYDNGKCGGVPFFFNKKTGKSICGETSFDKLKQWALGK